MAYCSARTGSASIRFVIRIMAIWLSGASGASRRARSAAALAAGRHTRIRSTRAIEGGQGE